MVEAQARELTCGFLHLIREKAAIVAGLTLPVSHGAGGRAHQSPETRSVDKRMAGPGFPSCNTASRSSA
ncbi:MAG TPA: hypothetical protein VF043_20515 [Ktedonobacteraceae bacterium]